MGGGGADQRVLAGRSRDGDKDERFLPHNCPEYLRARVQNDLRSSSVEEFSRIDDFKT